MPTHAVTIVLQRRHDVPFDGTPRTWENPPVTGCDVWLVPGHYNEELFPTATLFSNQDNAVVLSQHVPEDEAVALCNTLRALLLTLDIVVHSYELDIG